MQNQKLPISINPFRLAEKQAKLAGVLCLAHMPRLKELLGDAVGEVTVTIDFGYDKSHAHFIHLKANANLILTCQRCMENFSYPITINVLLSPMLESAKIAAKTALNTNKVHVKPKNEDNQQDNLYEPLVMDSETVILADMVEDEILLNLPLIAKHTQDACPVVLSESNEGETKNPFEVYFSKINLRDKS